MLADKIVYLRVGTYLNPPPPPTASRPPPWTNTHVHPEVPTNILFQPLCHTPPGSSPPPESYIQPCHFMVAATRHVGPTCGCMHYQDDNRVLSWSLAHQETETGSWLFFRLVYGSEGVAPSRLPFPTGRFSLLVDAHLAHPTWKETGGYKIERAS